MIFLWAFILIFLVSVSPLKITEGLIINALIAIAAVLLYLYY